MKERKYLDRFRVNGSGRGAEYAGEYYAFPGGVQEVRQRGGRVCAWMAAFWVLTLVHLFNARVTDRCLYALMPILCALVPAAYGAMGAISTLMNPARMTVVQRDKGPGRALRSSAGAMVLIAAGTVGCVIRISLSGAWDTAWHEALLPLLAALSMACAFREARAAWHAAREVH